MKTTLRVSQVVHHWKIDFNTHTKHQDQRTCFKFRSCNAFWQFRPDLTRKLMYHFSLMIIHLNLKCVFCVAYISDTTIASAVKTNTFYHHVNMHTWMFWCTKVIQWWSTEVLPWIDKKQLFWTCVACISETTTAKTVKHPVLLLACNNAHLGILMHFHETYIALDQ